MFRLFLVLTCAAAAFGQLLQEAHPAPEPYSFAFSSPNEDGTASNREETGDASGRITGSYTIQGADGQNRRVEYVADQDGFRANVITNEIGTESQNPNPADVNLVSSAPTAAELSAQWEASGLGRARLAVPRGPVIAAGPAAIAVARPAIAVARPAIAPIGPAIGAIGINRGVGLVSAPIAPIAGGLIRSQGVGFGVAPVGIRANLNLGVPALATNYGGLALRGNLAPNVNVLLSRGQLAGPVASGVNVVSGASFGGRLATKY